MFVKILVLAGGSSAEREVSLESGRCVLESLRTRGHDVELLDPWQTPIATLDSSRWDIAIPMVHGTGGEDGVLQAALVAVGIPYVGSSPAASELTFDKVRTNELLRQHGIDVPESLVLAKSQSIAERRTALATFNIDMPGVVTKPSRQGSSIGVSIVRQPTQIMDAVELAFKYDDLCLVERLIEGREVTVSVVDGTAFPAIEIRPATAWYDYDAKYADDRTEYVVAPDGLPDSLDTTSIEACRQCGVTGIARVDFRIDNDGRAWLLEINTIPGMTPHSLVPKSRRSYGPFAGENCANPRSERD